MGDKTTISWTDATFNPWWGCSKVSPGCDRCYAERQAHRYMPTIALWGAGRDASRRVFDQKHWNAPLGWNRKAGESGNRMRVFCASMADVFDNHPGTDDERDRLWTLINKTPNLDWQLLTKRVSNVARMVPPSWLAGHWPKHVWLGISVVNQEEADRDIPKLLSLPARIRWLSCEPLLGPINIGPYLSRDHLFAMLPGFKDPMPGVVWVVAGGESGPGARPMHPDWVRLVRDQCAAARVPFHFKQWGEWGPDEGPGEGRDRVMEGARCAWWDGISWQYQASGYHVDLEASRDSGEWLYRLGKNASGRTLDGRLHDGWPA